MKLWRQWQSMGIWQKLILIGMLLILVGAIALRVKGF